MKKYIWFVSFSVLLFSIFIGCQKQNSNAPQTVASQPSAPVQRKILLECFNGHLCGLCPGAEQEMFYLDSLYGGQVIPVSIQSGYFAEVLPNQTPAFPTDLRCADGNEIDSIYQISVYGNPSGMVNRINYSTTTFNHAQIKNDWQQSVAGMVNQNPLFKIAINTFYNSGTQQLNTTITTTALQNISGNYKLVVILTEDSIIAEQNDYTQTPSYIPNYRFDNVMRDAITPAMGIQLINGTVPANQVITSTFNNYSFNSAWLHNKCRVIAYIYDADSSSPVYMEVMQAEETQVN